MQRIAEQKSLSIHALRCVCGQVRITGDALYGSVPPSRPALTGRSTGH